MIKIILLSFFALWTVFGVAFYFFMPDKGVKKQPQKIVFYFLSGPLVWIFGPIIFLLDFIAEKIFEPLYKWLTKE
jgi:hypothetical protein